MPVEFPGVLRGLNWLRADWNASRMHFSGIPWVKSFGDAVTDWFPELFAWVGNIVSLDGHKQAVLALLRSASQHPLRDEAMAWQAIEMAILRAGDTKPDPEPRKRLDAYVYALGLIYTHQTGAFPAFTNSENETRFERFVCGVPAPVELRATRNLIKAATRRLNAKRNPAFVQDLRLFAGDTAAEYVICGAAAPGINGRY